MDEEKTLKDEYKKYFKELRKYICLGLNGIVVLFPMLLFMVHLYQLGDANPATLDTTLAIVTNVLWAPFPLWFYFKKEHGYTAMEYIVDSLKFMATLPILILMMVMPIVIMVWPFGVTLGALLYFKDAFPLLLFLLSIILNALWLPLGERLTLKFFSLFP
jgi:hypothetical protein